MAEPGSAPPRDAAVEGPIAVIGSSTTVGRAVLERLSRTAVRVLAVDGTGPDMPPGRAEVRLMDARDRLLPLAVEGVDAIVHAAFSDDLAASPDALYGHNVGGTRNVLDAASKAGVGRLVVISSTVVYGAHHDNPVPLPTSAPLRANPGFAYAHHRMLVEEMVAAWAADHPSTEVAVLRVAPLLAPGLDGALASLLTGPRLLVPGGSAHVWQFAHPADVADAVAVVLAQRLTGAYNVASDGWLTAEEVAAVTGRRLLHVGQTTLEQAMDRASAFGVSPAPAESMPYLLHPWAVDVGELRDHGWRPRHTNRDVLAGFAEASADVLSLGTLRASRRGLWRTGSALLGASAWALWWLTRRRRRP